MRATDVTHPIYIMYATFKNIYIQHPINLFLLYSQHQTNIKKIPNASYWNRGTEKDTKRDS